MNWLAVAVVLIVVGILMWFMGALTLAAWEQYRSDSQPSPRDGGELSKERGD